MDPSEYFEYENRAYLSPTISRDEQLGFVNTLRDTVERNTDQINTQTQNLGTNITSNLGGLTGSNSYFKQRYQTAPLEAQMNTLKATAQAKALNDLMSNYQNQAANRYSQAYRSAKAKAAAAAAGGGGGGGYDTTEGKKRAVDRGYALDTSKYIGKTINGQPVKITATSVDGDYVVEKDQFGNIWDVYKWSPDASQFVRVSGNDGQYQVAPQFMGDNFYHSTSSNDYRNNKSAYDLAQGATDLLGLYTAPGYWIGNKIGQLFAGKTTTTYE